jgi:hypothetical protein
MNAITTNLLTNATSTLPPPSTLPTNAQSILAESVTGTVGPTHRASSHDVRIIEARLDSIADTNPALAQSLRSQIIAQLSPVEQGQLQSIADTTVRQLGPGNFASFGGPNAISFEQWLDRYGNTSNAEYNSYVQIAGTAERGAVLNAMRMVSRGGVDFTQMAAMAMAARGAIGVGSLDMAALLRGATQGIGPYAAILGRFSVLTLPLALSGDTPQPRATDMRFGDLIMRMTAPRPFTDVGTPGTRVEFFRKEPGLFHFGSGETRLPVAVSTQNGRISVDLAELQAAYGRPLPEGILAAVGRPPTVGSDLQVTIAGTNAAMAGSQDPCRDMKEGQNHHIIPARLTKEFETFYRAIGYHPDNADNVIRLPKDDDERKAMEAFCNETRPLHSGNHSKAYVDAMQQHVTRIQTRFNNGEINATQAKAEMNRLTQEVGQLMRSEDLGKLSVNDPDVAVAIRELEL